MNELRQQVRVTHPFHPLSGRSFELVAYRHSWGGRPVVDCVDAGGQVVTVPLAWTDAAEEDPFVALSGGRAHFRVEDLVRLLDLLAEEVE